MLHFMSRVVNIIILSSVLNSCGLDLDAMLAKSADKMVINGTRYSCWNIPTIAINSENILYRIAEIAKDDLPVTEEEAIKLLSRNGVWVCQLPPYILYEYCGIVRSVGCYSSFTNEIWIVSKTLVHELFHHFIAVVYNTSEARDLSHRHEHPIQIKYEKKIMEEFDM